ncbi:hypothetical protein F5148DRAFT_497696 [Russula earlei]|uniref:Uncharacterized protein n=1 Tax=Russula earlei TaxID=71964 RepID=A0ACC0TYG9_9AGAM|nr:hypothetical protein F5148DRAFT_497696 [Russula earlei]
MSNAIKTTEKKRPQGRIVDFLNKQAQQPPSDSGSGLRPLDPSSLRLSSGTKGFVISGSGAVTQTAGRPCDSNAVEGTRRILRATDYRPPSSTSDRVLLTKPTISTLASDARIHSRPEIIPRNSVTSQSCPVSQQAKAPTASAHTTVGRLLEMSTDAVDSHHSLCVAYGEAISSQRAPPASSSNYKTRRLLTPSAPSSDLIYTQPSSANPAQPSITFARSPGPASMYACKTPGVEAIHARRVIEKRNGTPNEFAQATLPRTVSPTQLPLTVASYHKSDLPTHQPRNPSPASQFLPIASQAQGGSDELSESTPLHPQSFPTSVVDPSYLSPLRTRESPYNHSTLQPPPDDDSEWTTFPRRKPRHHEQPKNLITASARFRLPIHSRVLPPPTELPEGKRPRISLYRPPPRTVTVDLAGLEGRYALVRGAMRK